MPIHDWTRVPAGLFHHFHLAWCVEISRVLNRAHLPKSVSALLEKHSQTRVPDPQLIKSRSGLRRGATDTKSKYGIATIEPAKAQIVRSSSKEIYSGRANRIVIRHHLGRILAIIEIISPGNKDTRSALRDFVDKTMDFLKEGIHVLIVDLFPPTPRDPYGLHKAIWDEIEEEDFQFPPGKDRILVSYKAGTERVAYIEPVAVGDFLPEMPLFLSEELHVPVPLEPTYQATWDALPVDFRTAVETGRLPQADPEE